MRINNNIKWGVFLILFFSLTFSTIWAEDSDDSGFGFGLGMDLGVESFLDYDEDTDSYETVTYQKIGFVPDFAIGDFGLSLDLSFHVASDPDSDYYVKFREEDWVPEENTFDAWMTLYLSKFNYVRYGYKGEDLFVKAGSIDDATLGTGFIMGNYANTMFQPNDKLFGLTFDMDGNLFGFPYLGFESFVGNLAHPDVIGGRLYGRPLAWLENIPIVDLMEVGFTIAADIDPTYRDEYFLALDYYSDATNYVDWDTDDDGEIDDGVEVDDVVIWGLDIIQPILSNPVISLAAFTSYAVEPVEGGASSGFMLGAGGRLISFIPYMAQLRFLGENFIPTYFDTTYDLYRAQKYAVMSGDADTIDSFVGWMVSSGFSILEDQIAFSLSLDGPFDAVPTTDADEIFEYSPSEFPHLKAAFTVAEDLIPGVFFDAYYDKQYITEFMDIFDATGAIIGANINYKTGPAIITLNYDVKYDPSTGSFDTTAKLMTSIGLF